MSTLAGRHNFFILPILLWLVCIPTHYIKGTAGNVGDDGALPVAPMAAPGQQSASGHEDTVALQTTQAFFQPIRKAMFGSFSDQEPLEFLPAVLGMPDLPSWMFYKYPNGSRQAYLYGTPLSDGDISIEIVALNRHTYDTYRKTIKFTVIEPRATHEVELKLSNMNIEDIFVSNRSQQLLAIFQERLWEQSVYLTMIVAPTDAGGRLPINPKEKEGVIVRIGSPGPFSRDLLDLEREVEPIKNRNPCPKKYKATSAEHLFRDKHFQVDWCSFHLYNYTPTFTDLGHPYGVGNVSAYSDTRLFVEAPLLGDDGSNLVGSKFDESEQGRSKGLMVKGRDHSSDMLFALLIPMLVGFVIISTLCCLFFYKEQLEKFERQMPLEQLHQYESLQRVHSQMRQMANNRDVLP